MFIQIGRILKVLVKRMLEYRKNTERHMQVNGKKTVQILPLEIKITSPLMNNGSTFVVTKAKITLHNFTPQNTYHDN